MIKILKKIFQSFKRVNGNSLAEFATTTALMATLPRQHRQNFLKWQKILREKKQ